MPSSCVSLQRGKAELVAVVALFCRNGGFWKESEESGLADSVYGCNDSTSTRRKCD